MNRDKDREGGLDKMMMAGQRMATDLGKRPENGSLQRHEQSGGNGGFRSRHSSPIMNLPTWRRDASPDFLPAMCSR